MSDHSGQSVSLRPAGRLPRPPVAARAALHRVLTAWLLLACSSAWASESALQEALLEVVRDVPVTWVVLGAFVLPLLLVVTVVWRWRAPGLVLVLAVATYVGAFGAAMLFGVAAFAHLGHEARLLQAYVAELPMSTLMLALLTLFPLCTSLAVAGGGD